MSYRSGWALIETKSKEQIKTWTGAAYGECPAQPNVIYLPNNDQIHCPAINTDYSGYMLVPTFDHNEPPKRQD